MSYPGTIIAYEDYSDISTVTLNTVKEKPLYMATFTSDKGSEDWGVYEGKNFFNMYGNDISFAKHGQPLLQTAMSINAGAKVLCKRVVSDTATLANIGIVATVTVTPGVDPAPDTVSVTYSAVTVEDVKTHDAAVTAITAAATGENKYLLYVFTDNGRGVSSKRIMIQPNYTLSKSLDYTLYTLSVIENGTVIETVNFALDPDIISNNTNISLQSMVKTNSTQIKCTQIDEGITGYLSAVQTAIGLTDANVAEYDMLFACTKKGAVITSFSINIATGLNLQSTYGQSMTNGENGTFSTTPITASDYATETVKAWDGTFSNVIYNVDKYKVDCIIDANYDDTIKRAIEDLVTFREDAFYFRDLGKTANTLTLITAADTSSTKNKFCGSYGIYYDVLDPYSKKQITVTVGYSLAQLLVNHFNNGRSLPLAGIKNRFILTDAIEGTVNFIPVITPDTNQKDELEDVRINYASYIDNNLVIETLYTSQDKLTAFSYINNILAIQQVVKRIRTRCPVIRYSFIDGKDLEAYLADVNEIIEPYTTNFNTLTMQYMGDETYTAQKIFYAMLKVKFKDFVQTEYFRVAAVSSSSQAIPV